jgi:hypothetical protein
MLRLKPGLRGALLALPGLLLLLVGLWIWIGIRIGIWTYPQYQRHIWLVENTPVAHLLWSHQINAGDNPYALIHEWRPDHVVRFGPWIEMRWFPGGAPDDAISFIGACVIAKDGQLVFASAYSDDGLNNRIFFNTWTTNDEAEFDAAYRTYNEHLIAENALLIKGFPMLQQLWQSNIKAGDDAENVIKLWHPALITEFGQWMVLRWFQASSSAATRRVMGVRLIARNGVLVCANSFSDDGHHSAFFDIETQQDKDDFDSAYDKYEEGLAAKIGMELSKSNTPSFLGTNNVPTPVISRRQAGM